MRLTDLPKDEILDPSWVADYQTKYDALWQQVTFLVNRMYINGKVSEFPIDLFCPPHRSTFLREVFFTFYQAALMCIWRIAVDTGRDFLTIRGLKNQIAANIRKDGPHDHSELKEAFLDLVRASDFEQVVGAAEESVRDLRHSYLAHLRTARVDGTDPRTSAPLPVARLEKLTEAITRQMTVLGFGLERPYLLPEYNDRIRQPVGRRGEPDIDRLLTHVVADSEIIYWPEKSPQGWKFRRPGLSEEELSWFNHYREKLGLPRA
ncbi:hypothetical protein [Longibacter salinarum]|nr:hypothetical protein [Longibacter salinarum]